MEDQQRIVVDYASRRPAVKRPLQPPGKLFGVLIAMLLFSIVAGLCAFVAHFR